MKKITNNSGLYFYLLLFLLSLIPLIWLRGSDFVAGEEFYAVNYAKWGEIFSDIWTSRVNYGEFSILLPFRFQGWILEILNNLSPYFGTSSPLIIWQVILWLLGAVSFYKLGRHIFSEAPRSVVFVMTVFYVLNPYFLNISPLLSPPRILFSILPIVALLGFELLKEETMSSTVVSKLAFLVFFSTPLFVNLPLGVALLFFIFALLSVGLFQKKRKKLLAIQNICVFIVLLFVTNLWWLYPNYLKLRTQLEIIKADKADFSAINVSKLSDLVVGHGSWALREKAGDYYYFPYHVYYDQFPLVVLKYLPFVFLAITIYLFSAKKITRRFEEKVLFICLGLFLFLASGSSGPLGGLFLFVYKNIPGFWIFREPYAKFMPVYILCLSLLCIPSISYLYKQNFKNFKAFFMLTILMFFLIIGFPYFDKGFLGTTNADYLRSPKIQVPDGWEELESNWKPKDGYYISYPANSLTNIHIWPSGYTGSPLLMFTGVKFINPEGLSSINNATLAKDLIGKMLDSPGSFLKVLKKYNISGIVFFKDTLHDNDGDLYSKVNENFKDYLAFSNESVAVYEFPDSLNEVVLLSKDQVFYVDGLPQDINKLPTLVSTPQNYIVHGSLDNSESTDYVVLKKTSDKISSGERLVVYEFPEIKNDLSDVLIFPKNGYISEEESDHLTLRWQVESNYLYNKNWHPFAGFENLSSEDLVENAFKKPGFSFSDDSFYAFLKNFNPQGVYIINFNFDEVQKDNIFLSIFYVDNKDFSNPQELYRINSFSSNSFGVLDLSNIGKANTNLDREYFIFMSLLTPQTTYLLNSNLIPFEEPLVLAKVNDGSRKIEDENNFEPIISEDTIRLDDTLALVKFNLPEDFSGFLQFKNTFDKNWKLVSITQEESSLMQDKSSSLSYYLMLLKVMFRSSFSGEPLNMEGYSNAWEVNLPKGESNFAVMFVPKYVSDILFVAAFVLFGVLFVFAKRKKIYGVYNKLLNATIVR